MKKTTSNGSRLLIPLIIVFALSLCAATWSAVSSGKESVAVNAQIEHDHDGYTAWENTTSLPTSAGSYYLVADVTISSTWSVPSGTTNLCLNGHGIIRTGNGSVINLTGGRVLNLYDCNETIEHKFSVAVANEQTGAGLATVNDALTENYKTFTGGYITGGNAGYGGGVYMENGTFNMYGGTLIGNQGSTDGGVINMHSGANKFTMYGGAIRYNFGRTGGALFIESGSEFILEGGVISHNYCGLRSGAIFSRGAIKIHGGEIANNFTKENTVIDLWGGTIEVTGGVINDNSSTVTDRAGVRFTDNMFLGGDPVVADNKDSNGDQANFYVQNNGYVSIVGALSDSVKDNKIGVTMQAGSGVFTKDWSKYMGDKDPADYFFSENADYEIVRVKGEAKLVKEPYTLISFDGGDEGVTGKMEKDILEDGATSFTLPSETTFRFDGKALVGWKLGDIVYGLGETVTLGSEDVTFTAVWTDGVTVTFDARGGSAVESRCIIPDTVVQAPSAPIKSGYTFLYWTLDGAEYDFSAPVTQDITLKALWAKGVSFGESFESGALPSGWTTSGDYTWNVGVGDGDGGNAHTGAKNAIAQKDDYGGETWLITSEMDLSGKNSASLGFWYMNRDWGGDTDEFGVYYRISGGDWQEIFYTSDRHDWTEWSGNLPAGALAADVQIGFKAYSNWGYGVALDDITFESTTPHSHEWTYTADGNVITTTCAGMSDGTCNLEAQTLTITAEDKDFDGEPVVATVVKSDNWTAYGFAELPEIVYSGNTDPGTYTASVTVGGATASAEFTITATVYHGHDDIFFKEWTSTNSLPTTAGNYFLSADVTISGRWDVPSGTTNLCLNGFGITRTNASGTTGSVIQVGSGATLNLYDCGTETRYYTIENPSPNGAGLGTIVDESTYNAADENARGTFVGGYITGGVITGEQDGNHLIGGGVNVVNGSFTMYGGTIIGNWVCINGGGVKVKGAGASFTMNGGAILANYNQCYGGGISVGDNNSSRLCTLVINGGTIARNWSGRNGGAIHFDSYAHTFVLTGGTIVNNYTNGNFESLGRSGGGILLDGATLRLSGDPVIKDNIQGAGLDNNVYIRTNSKILDLGDGLGDDADVGICAKEASASADVKIAVNASIKDIRRLHFDVESDGCLVFCDGENDWICVDGEIFELVGAHHTHEANTVWASVNPFAVVTAGEEVMYFSSFDAALTAWTDGSTLTLLHDATTDSTIEITGSVTKTLDLNGHGIKKTGTGRVFTVIDGATFNIKDGNPQIEHKFTVSNGLATVNDGLQSDYKTFTGGYITGGNAVGGDAEGWGGCLGVSFSGIRATVNMSGGTIIGNRCDMSGAAIRVGGDTNGNGDTVFNMTGGAIMYNTAGMGGAISWEEAGVTIKISGGIIDNNFVGSNEVNVYLTNGQKITVDSAFTAAASISVTLEKGQGVFTNGWADYMGESDPADYFTSGDDSFIVRLVNGEAAIMPPHTHDWTYTAYGNVITATCVGEGDCDLTSQTLTITAVGKTYDGAAVVASVEKSENWTAYGLADPTGIVYSGNTAAGEYTASVTVGDKTATVQFVINKKALTITAAAKEKTYGESDPELTYTVSGLVGDDTLTGALTREAGENVGSYAITQGTLTAGDNYTIDYTGANLTISEATMSVSAAGYEGDYDGATHSISVTVSAPDGAEVRFGTVEGNYTLNASPSYTDVGTYTVCYRVTKANYTTVSGSATIKINPIDVTVTIIGNHFTADYDGEEHAVSGYTATASSALYDVTKDFTFSGTATAKQTNAGTAEMGLAASRFTNTNNNFATVTFNVTDGYITVETVDAVILTAPEDKKPIYDGSEQPLVSEGSTEGGVIYYGLSKDAENAPADESYSTTVPSAKELGYYYVWYKVEADGNHNDLAPVCIKISIAEADWVILSGVIYGSDGVTAIAGASVTLVKGNREIDYVTTDEDGKYSFIVPTGMYSVVADNNGNVETTSVALFEDKEQDLVTSDGKTESILRIDTGDDEDIGVAVSGLNDEARSVRDGAPGAQSVSVTMTVEIKTEETAVSAVPIVSAAGNRSLDFYEIKVEKTIDSVTTLMDTTANVLEIAIPYANAGKRGLSVYSYHDSTVRTFMPSDTKENGTFRVDIENRLVYIYTNSFSTYAIGYTPYYRVGGSITLGSYEGKAKVTIKSVDGETVFTYENVAMGEINFEDIPMGRYVMTITWTDGVANTLSMPLNIGDKYGDRVFSATSEENSSTVEPNLAGEAETVLKEDIVPVKKASGCYISGVTARPVATSPICDDESDTPELYSEQTAIVANKKDGKKNGTALPETVA